MSDNLSQPLLTLRLKRREARRIVAGHPWVFANEIETVDPAGSSAGLCRILDDSKRYIGTGYFNKHSLIAGRIVTRDPEERIDGALFAQRLEAALQRRRDFYPEGEAFRWVYGEADGLPGLVVDRYPGLIVVQVGTLGMELLQPVWEPPLRDLCAGLPLLFRNDGALRRREGLAEYIAFPDGLPPDRLNFREADTPVVALPHMGQKTGYYLDQRENRVWARRLAEGARVLDLFCYTGAWGLGLLHSGARNVTFVDQSNAALDAATEAAERAGVVSRTAFFVGDALDFLRTAAAEKHTYSLVVVDPPSFIPTRKAYAAGRRGYLGLFKAALDVVEPGGYAVLCSCSYHLPDKDFADVVKEAGARSRRAVEYLWRGGAGPDHPEPANLPESHYLKCAFLRVY